MSPIFPLIPPNVPTHVFAIAFMTAAATLLALFLWLSRLVQRWRPGSRRETPYLRGACTLLALVGNADNLIEQQGALLLHAYVWALIFLVGIAVLAGILHLVFFIRRRNDQHHYHMRRQARRQHRQAEQQQVEHAEQPL